MLKDATTEKKRFSTIGVVRGFKPPRSAPTNGQQFSFLAVAFFNVFTDWASTVCLQDPSLFSDEDFYATRDYTITFFQRKFKEWLPQVNIGDILVLHEIKAGSPYFTYDLSTDLLRKGPSLQWAPLWCRTSRSS
jgi:hypothetical protein